MEVPISAGAQAAAFTRLLANFTREMHKVAPFSRISFDSSALAAPCSGNPPPNSSVAGDHYDQKGIAEAVDYLVVMDCECRNVTRIATCSVFV